jgi:nudix-type nucleoside diphosphatase (YffH/AdpP family)
VVRLTTFQQRRHDGTSTTLKRESYDRGDSSAILLYNAEARTVLLTRQFRYPAYEHGHEDGMLLEAAAGSVEPGEDPADTIRRETSEELGVEIGVPEHLFGAYLSPGALTEHQDFYAASYAPATRTGPGGGLAEEGEDIEVLELAFDDALAMIDDGRVVDAKTIILLQWAALSGPFRAPG